MTTAIRARRDEEKEQRRNAILDAAEKIIARHGWEDTDFGKVAARARLSRSLVYVYFPTRDDLFHAICNRGLTLLEKSFAAAISKKSPGLDQVVALGRAYYAYSQKEPFYFELLTHFQARELDPDDQSTSEEGANVRGRACLDILATALATGLADGSIRKAIGPPGPAAFTIWAFTHGLIQIARAKEPMLQRDFKFTTGQMVEHSLKLLRGAIAAE